MGRRKGRKEYKSGISNARSRFAYYFGDMDTYTRLNNERPKIAQTIIKDHIMYPYMDKLEKITDEDIKNFLEKLIQ